MKKWLRRIAHWAVVIGVVRLFRADPPGSRTPSGPSSATAAHGAAGDGQDGATSAPGPVPVPAPAPAPAENGEPETFGRRWWGVVSRAWTTSQHRQVSLLAAGVAFYAFISLFPAIIATIMIYGLVADPATIQNHAERLAEAVPESARQLVLDQVGALATVSRGSLSMGLVVALVIALWGASGVVNNLMNALNVAYGVRDQRPFAQRRGIALGLTAATIVGGVCLLGLVAVYPALQRSVNWDGWVWMLLGYVRWILLAALLIGGLTVIYRVGPDARTSWRSPGALVATVLWLVASFGFSYYVTNFSSYSATYGSLAAVVILLMWLWITFYIILLGAAINAQVAPRTAAVTDPGDRSRG